MSRLKPADRRRKTIVCPTGMFVSIRMRIYQRSGYMLARLMASSESGGVSRWPRPLHESAGSLFPARPYSGRNTVPLVFHAGR